MTAPDRVRRGRILLARLDSLGDILLAGPAVRAVAGAAAHLTMPVGAARASAAQLLPGLDDVLELDAPCVVFDRPPVSPQALAELVRAGQRSQFDRARTLTS